MGNRFYATLLLTGLVLASCSNEKRTYNGGTSEEERSLPVINLSDNVEEVQQLNLSDAAERVEIVKLETTDKNLIGNIANVQVTSNDIWVQDLRENRISRFTHDGKFLNKVGKIGQGPEEYTLMYQFFVDDANKEVYVVSTVSGIKVYDYEGNFKRRVTKTKVDDLFFCDADGVIYYDGNYILSQHLLIQRPVDIDSLWSLAWVDEDFQPTKIFKNPAHIGRENEIYEKGPFDWKVFVNYYVEEPTEYDFYNNELTFKFNDTDTIYVVDREAKDLVPQYGIYTTEDKGDYGLTHEFLKEAHAFNYFKIIGYYPTKDYIYLEAYKGPQILTYRYDKQDKSVQLVRRKTEILERKMGRYTMRGVANRRFQLTNDISGGIFTSRYRSSGRYWVDYIQPGTEDYDKYVADLRKAPDAPKKQELLNVIDNTDDEDNPILLIAVLK